jgi:plastocyanin
MTGRVAVVAAALAGVALVAPLSATAATGNTVNDYAVGSTFVLGALSLRAPSGAVRIRTGDTVVWTNLDPIAHDVTFKDRSYALRTPGAQARRTFRKSGAFKYRCTIHPGMDGLVYVNDGAAY